MFQLLGELLLDRHNFQTMTRYISSPDNLKLMMIMLREKSRNIQFEAFHVFKVLVTGTQIYRVKPLMYVRWLYVLNVCWIKQFVAQF